MLPAGRQINSGNFCPIADSQRLIAKHFAIAQRVRNQLVRPNNDASGNCKKCLDQVDIAQTNTMAGMNFLSELTRVKGPTEAIELWSRHAQNQLQRLTEQSLELATLGQRIASSSTEPLTRGFDQTFRRAL
jgi:hypothetical protein